MASCEERRDGGLVLPFFCEVLPQGKLATVTKGHVPCMALCASRAVSPHIETALLHIDIC